MSKDKKRNLQSVTTTPEVLPSPESVSTVDDTTSVSVQPVVPPTTPAPLPKLSDIDKMALDLAKEQRKTALADAKTALANSEKAELSFRYVVLQIYRKYGLSDTDALTENGEIIKNGAVKPSQG